MVCSQVQSESIFATIAFLSQESKLRNEEISNDSKLSAAWPIWPVGLNNMHKAPLNYPKIPLPTYTPLDFSRRDRLQDNNTDSKQVVREEQTLQFNATTKRSTGNHARITRKYIPALTAYTSSALRLGESKHLKFTHPETKNLNEMRRLRVDLVPLNYKNLSGVDYMRLPLIGREKTNVQSHDQPGERKYCATGMLGVRFKTDAHKR